MLKPYLTEKSISKNKEGIYVFSTPIDFNKQEIKKFIEKTFSVKVESVQTLIKRGKVKRFKGHVGMRKDVKKAIFSISKGQVIPGFESDEKNKAENKPKDDKKKQKVEKAGK